MHEAKRNSNHTTGALKMSSKKNAKIATATATATSKTASNAQSAANDAATIAEKLAAIYGKVNPTMHAKQKASGVGQQGAALLLHAICAISKKSIAEARATLNTYTTCCHKRDGSIQAVCLQGGKQVYSEPMHYGFLYGSNADSKFNAFKVYATMKTDLATEYGKALCEAHKVEADKVKALITKLESAIK
jgi:hypothetical protein